MQSSTAHVALAHALIDWRSLERGLGKIEASPAHLDEDIDAAWEVLGEAVQTVLRAAGVPDLAPQASVTLEHFYLTLQAALDGLGIAMGPERLIADDVAAGRLVLPFPGPALRAWMLPPCSSTRRLTSVRPMPSPP